MIVDPVEAFATHTSSLLASSSVAPIPTVVPSLPEYESATDTGNRTLWYVSQEPRCIEAELVSAHRDGQ